MEGAGYFGISAYKYKTAWFQKTRPIYLISNFRHVLSVVCFLLGNSPVSEFYMLTFQNTVCYTFIGGKVWRIIPIRLWRWNRQSVPKHRHIKFRHQRITQKKAYNETNIIFSNNITLLWDLMPHNLICKNQCKVSSSHSCIAEHWSRLGCYTLTNCK
jgi:hypothetical protein